jgi:hypothetical protein
MCFSSGASFVSAALLIPAGLASCRVCHHSGRPELLPLALSPLLFGLQQGLEGLVWLGLDRGGPAALIHTAALSYLFFAYAFWLAWMPWCALRAHQGGSSGVGPWLQGCFGCGLALGLWLWLPLLLQPWRIQPAVLLGNLTYNTQTPVLAVLSLAQGGLLYGLLITVPLMLAGSGRLRGFALALALAYGLAWLGYRHAFVSTWCFFSAALSLLLLWVVREPATAPPGPLPAQGLPG